MLQRKLEIAHLLQCPTSKDSKSQNLPRSSWSMNTTGFFQVGNLKDIPGGLVVKNSPVNAGDPGFDP